MVVSYFLVFVECVYLAKAGERARTVLNIAPLLFSLIHADLELINLIHITPWPSLYFGFSSKLFRSNNLHFVFKLEEKLYFWDFGCKSVFLINIKIKIYRFKNSLILFFLSQIMVFCLVESVTNKVAPYDIVIGSFYSLFKAGNQN